MKKFKLIIPLLLISLSSAASSNKNGETDFGTWLVHHVSNSSIWHLPLGFKIDFNKLPINLFGLDLTISLHVAMIIIAAIIMLILLPIAARRKNTIPVNRFGNAIEAMVIFLREDLAYNFLGKKYARKWTPFILTLFFFLLTLNIMGLIPYMAAATGNINFTAGMAILVFFIFNIAGISKNGLSYVKNLAPAGVPIPVLFILYPIEIVSLFTKTGALAIRLFANLSAGHFIIFSLLGLIIVLKEVIIISAPLFLGFTLFIYLIEIIVVFLQAYVFTLLTTLFIGSAIQQEH